MGGTSGADGVGKSIKNLSSATKSAKSKKPKLTKPKKSDLIKVKVFAKTNFFRMDFLTLKSKKAFIYL